MKKKLAGIFVPSVRRWMRGIRFSAAAVALHGMLLGLASAVQALVPGEISGRTSGIMGAVFFWILAVPGLLLTFPFRSLLWRCGLMNAPGWFAWPKPSGVALAYVI